jgi:hypothetical protein
MTRKSRSRYYLFVGPFDVRVPRWFWIVSPLAGHIEGGAR